MYFKQQKHRINILITMNSESIKAALVKHLPDLSIDEIELKRVSGLTNITYAVLVNGVSLYIFKSFSEGCCHDFECYVCVQLSRQGHIPCMIFSNKDYRIDQFIQNSVHPKQNQIVEPPLLLAILSKMHSIHLLDIPFKEEQHKILSKTIFSQDTFYQLCCLKEKNLNNINYTTLLKKLLNILKQREKWANYLLPSANTSIKVCHNDLNNLNILVCDTATYLIDYDYADFNYIAYDIANLINETSFDYCPPQFPGFAVIKVYSPEELAKIAKNYPGYYPDLEEEVLKFMCVSNLYWGIWSLRRNELNVSEIFGILEHGLKRIELFEIYLKMVEKKYGKFA